MGTNLNGMESEIQSLRDVLYAISEKVKESMSGAVQSLTGRDAGMVCRVEALYLEVESMGENLETRCLDTVANGSFGKNALQDVATVIRISTDLRRIAGVALETARLSLNLSDLPKPLVDIPRMGEMVVKMLDVALIAYKKSDETLARQVCFMDEMVDDLDKQIYRELFLLVMENPRIMEKANALIWVSRMLESAGNHVTYLSRQIFYAITGKYLKEGA